MHKLCEYIDDELKELEKKAATGGKLTGSEVQYGDLLAHFKKSLLTNEAMEGNDYSERGMSYADRRMNRDNRGMSYDDGMSYGDYSGARGRGRNAKRDSIGRYAEYGYSRDYSEAKEDMIDKLREMMNKEEPEMRKEYQRFITKLESM